MGFLQFGLLFAAVGGVLGAVWASLQERAAPCRLCWRLLFLQSRRRRGGAVRAAGSGVDVRGGGGVRGDDDGARARYGARARAQGFARLSGRLGGKAYGCERRRVFGWKRLISSGIAAREDAVFRARPADARHYARGVNGETPRGAESLRRF